MRFIFSLIIIAFAVFGGYKFFTDCIDIDDGIQVKQSFKDDMNNIGEKLKSITDKVQDFVKEKF